MHHPAPIRPLRLRADGFTLIELMVVVVVLAVLAAIALPSYQQSIRKSRRSDAMTALAAMQQAQERWRGNNTEYQSALASLAGASAPTSPSGYYDLSIGSASATGYTMRATAIAGGKQAGDSACQIFEVTLANGTVSYASYASAAASASSPDPCWVK